MVALPIFFLLTTTQSLALTLILASLFSLPSLVNVLQFKRWWRVPPLLLMLSVVASVLWQMRSWIPPASLRLTEITISRHICRDARTHGESIDVISADALKQDGLYAWTAIHTARGLQEKFTIFGYIMTNRSIASHCILKVGVNKGIELEHRN